MCHFHIKMIQINSNSQQESKLPTNLFYIQTNYLYTENEHTSKFCSNYYIQAEAELGQAQVKLCRSLSLSCSKGRRGSCRTS